MNQLTFHKPVQKIDFLQPRQDLFVVALGGVTLSNSVRSGRRRDVGRRLEPTHGVEQSSRSLRRSAVGGTNIFAHIDVRYDSLEHTSGVIWTALCIDYPGHSFSHLGILYGQYHLFVRITVSF